MIYDMATLGLPFCPDGNHSSALIMDASAVQGLARDEAARLFGTRGILLDRAAWEQARQRRLDTLLTDVPVPDGLAGVECMISGNGGRTAVVPSFSARRQQCRKSESAAHRRLAFGREVSGDHGDDGSGRRRAPDRLGAEPAFRHAAQLQYLETGFGPAPPARMSAGGETHFRLEKSGTTGRNPASPVRRHGCGRPDSRSGRLEWSAGWPSNSIAAPAEANYRETGPIFRRIRLSLRTVSADSTSGR